MTVAESIDNSEDKEKTGGLAYLGMLAQSTPSAHNIRRYAEIVRERAVMRRLISVANQLDLSPTLAIPLSALAEIEQLRQRHSERNLAAFALRTPDIAGVTVDPDICLRAYKLSAHGFQLSAREQS